MLQGFESLSKTCNLLRYKSELKISLCRKPPYCNGNGNITEKKKLMGSNSCAYAL